MTHVYCLYLYSCYSPWSVFRHSRPGSGFARRTGWPDDYEDHVIYNFRTSPWVNVVTPIRKSLQAPQCNWSRAQTPFSIFLKGVWATSMQLKLEATRTRTRDSNFIHPLPSRLRVWPARLSPQWLEESHQPPDS